MQICCFCNIISDLLLLLILPLLLLLLVLLLTPPLLLLLLMLVLLLLLLILPMFLLLVIPICFTSSNTMTVRHMPSFDFFMYNFLFLVLLCDAHPPCRTRMRRLTAPCFSYRSDNFNYFSTIHNYFVPLPWTAIGKLRFVTHEALQQHKVVRKNFKNIYLFGVSPCPVEIVLCCYYRRLNRRNELQLRIQYIIMS